MTPFSRNLNCMHETVVYQTLFLALMSSLQLSRYSLRPSAAAPTRTCRFRRHQATDSFRAFRGHAGRAFLVRLVTERRLILRRSLSTSSLNCDRRFYLCAAAKRSKRHFTFTVTTVGRLLRSHAAGFPAKEQHWETDCLAFLSPHFLCPFVHRGTGDAWCVIGDRRRCV